MYSKKSQSELIENKDYNMVLLLPHNATKIKYFSKSFSIRFFLLVIKEYYVFLKVAANSLIGLVQTVLFIGEWGVNRRVDVAGYIFCYLGRSVKNRFDPCAINHPGDCE